MSKMPDSKRKYAVFTSITPVAFEVGEIALRSILEPKGKDGDDFEYIYALGEIVDQIMDLKPLDHLYFQSNRDDKNERGLIVRIQ